MARAKETTSQGSTFKVSVKQLECQFSQVANIYRWMASFKQEAPLKKINHQIEDEVRAALRSSLAESPDMSDVELEDIVESFVTAHRFIRSLDDFGETAL